MGFGSTIDYIQKEVRVTALQTKAHSRKLSMKKTSKTYSSFYTSFCTHIFQVNFTHRIKKNPQIIEVYKYILIDLFACSFSLMSQNINVVPA